MTRSRTPFTALLSSYVISIFGTSMSAVAIPWLVLTSTGSAAKTGLVGFAEMLPYVCAQALAGPAVDRLGLRRSFVWGNAVAALAVGAIPLVYATGGLSFGVLLVLVAVAGVVRGAADCANSALVPATAEAGGIALERAAGLNASANRAAILLGAPLSGVLIALTGPATVVAVDAATFAVAAAIAAAWVRVGEPATRSTQRSEGGALRSYARDLAAGLRFLLGDRLLLGIITMVTVANLLDEGYSVVMIPVWVRQEIGWPGALGLIGGVFGVGEVVGSLLGAWLGPRLPRRALYAVGFLVGASPRFVAFAFAGTLPPVLTVCLVTGMFGGSVNSVIGATMYDRIPDYLRTRVLGVIRASAWLGIPFGALIGGYAVQALGLRAALLAFGGAYLLTTLAPFVFPVWRQMRRADPVPTGEPAAVPA